MKHYIRAAKNDVIFTGINTDSVGMLDLWGEDQIKPVSGFVERKIQQKASNRTVEGKLRVDIVNSYRTFEITYDLLPVGRYNQIVEMFDYQCSSIYFIEYHKSNKCDTSSCSDSCDWIPVAMEISEAVYSNDHDIEFFTITLTESSARVC